MDLSSYRWKNRLLLIFAPSTSGEYEEQLRRFEGPEPDFEERHLLLGKFLEREDGELNGTTVSSEETAKLRDEFGVEGFTVILVGKDGTEKYRTGEPVAAEEIFRGIDAMPMRRREMRERK